MQSNQSRYVEPIDKWEMFLHSGNLWTQRIGHNVLWGSHMA